MKDLVVTNDERSLPATCVEYPCVKTAQPYRTKIAHGPWLQDEKLFCTHGEEERWWVRKWSREVPWKSHCKGMSIAADRHLRALSPWHSRQSITALPTLDCACDAICRKAAFPFGTRLAGFLNGAFKEPRNQSLA